MLKLCVCLVFFLNEYSKKKTFFVQYLHVEAKYFDIKYCLTTLALLVKKILHNPCV
jgi:hypothetical protein